MKVIQINLNHCRTAQDILSQMIIDEQADVVLISEPYKNIDNQTWAKDKSGLAAIWTRGKHAFQEIGQAEGFVRAKVNGTHFYSCYARPSATIEEYQMMLRNLVTDVQGRNPVVIGGDFNAWATEWGSRVTNARGRVLLETLAPLNISIANTGEVYTYRKAGVGSIIDITFVSNSLAPNIKWRVSEEYSHSDHQAIIYEIKDKKKLQKPKLTGPKWNDKMFDKDAFEAVLDEYELSDGMAETMVQELTKCITEACDAAMPRRIQNRRGTPCYWWNDEIKDFRAKCLQARRKVQRSRRRANFQECLENFRLARRELDRAIKASKTRCFRDLCNEADINPWGTAYRLVMSKVRGQKTPQVRCPVILRNIVENLFPQRPTTITTNIVREIDEEIIPEVTVDELIVACRRIKEKKTPGPDGVPNKALKAAIHRRPDIFVRTMQKCLDEGVFPDQWKLQNLVLLPKGNKPPEDPSSYRPICLLDTMGKILERLIYNRLLDVAEEKKALSDRQFGFRKGKSTVDAIKMVVDIASKAIEGERWLHGTKEYCAVVTLDVKNAFNTADWAFIKKNMTKMTAPYYLRRIVSNYFSNRKLRYDSDEGERFYFVTAGVPQGSVLGPLLWIIMYDGVLRLKLPKGVKIIGFADDIALVIVAKYIHELEALANEAIALIRQWLEEARLKLAEHKTEVVLISSRKKIEYMQIQVGDQTIVSKDAVKYLGVMIDNRLKFKTHVEYSSKKAAQIQTALTRMLPNIGGPGYDRRILLSRVTSSVLLYAAPVWAGSLKTKEIQRMIARPYRLAALRAICGYRTVSDEAAYMVAGMLPIEIAAEEMQRIYLRKMTNGQGAIPLKVIKDEERAVSMTMWQDRWNNSSKGRWTHRLIPDIKIWISRSHGVCNYHLTQFLTGHGGYRKYLHRFGHDSSALCPECPEQEEDAEHVVFKCKRFEEGREGIPGPSSIIEFIMNSEENWAEVCTYVTNVQTELRRIEKLRRAEETNNIEGAA